MQNESHISSERAASRVFVGILYVVAGVYLFFNSLSLLSGQVLALLPITVQLTVLISVYRRTEWAWKVVLAWGAFMIVAGGAHWLAMVLRPEPIDFTSFNNLRLTASLVLGWYFVTYSREFLSARASERARSASTQ
jgi:hypothetical protein